MTFVVFNGASGGLGRHLGTALTERNLQNAPLGSRLGDVDSLLSELEQLVVEPGTALALIQSAALVSVGAAADDPDRAYDVNVTRTVDTVAAFAGWAADRGHAPGVVFVSSGHVYAPPDPGNRVAEDAPVRPMSVYAKTKLAAEERLRDLAEQLDHRLIVARVFGMIGPDQRPGYLLPGLVRRAREGDLVEIPGLDNVRDYLDTRDVAGHLASLVVEGDGGTVNVCSGEPTRVGDLLDQVLQVEHGADPQALEAARRRVTSAPGRDSDVAWLVGDPTRLARYATGPVRSISIGETIAEAMA